jgi:hypothetical protein
MVKNKWGTGGIAKMWVECGVGGAADLGEWNPGPPAGGEAYTDLLYAVFLVSTILSPIL